jgi:septal ring factor EnvC (AmiA/AmiB activator)
MATSEEIENKRIEKLKEIGVHKERLFLISDEIHAKEMEIIAIEDNERKPMEDQIRLTDERIRGVKTNILELKATAKKARELISRLNNEEEILKSDFWRSKS